jgi:hypothetical protein
MTLPTLASLKAIDRTKILKGITYAAVSFVVLDLAWYLYRGPRKIRALRRR